MIDEGETDWKVMCIDVKDELADKINNLEDVEKLKPGYLADTRKWFRTYKVPDGKPENNFAFDGEYKDKAFADQIIAETYQQWQTLVRGEAESSLAIENVSVDGSKVIFHRSGNYLTVLRLSFLPPRLRPSLMLPPPLELLLPSLT